MNNLMLRVFYLFVESTCLGDVQIYAIGSCNSSCVTLLTEFNLVVKSIVSKSIT